MMRQRLVGVAVFPLLLVLFVVWTVADFFGRLGRRV